MIRTLDCGCIEYVDDGYLHREDGPAVINTGGCIDEFYKYYLHGHGYSFDDWFELLTFEQKIAALYNPENF